LDEGKLRVGEQSRRDENVTRAGVVPEVHMWNVSCCGWESSGGVVCWECGLVGEWVEGGVVWKLKVKARGGLSVGNAQSVILGRRMLLLSLLIRFWRCVLLVVSVLEWSGAIIDIYILN
jgi:hypothetical protein